MFKGPEQGSGHWFIDSRPMREIAGKEKAKHEVFSSKGLEITLPFPQKN